MKTQSELYVLWLETLAQMSTAERNMATGPAEVEHEYVMTNVQYGDRLRIQAMVLRDVLGDWTIARIEADAEIVVRKAKAEEQAEHEAYQAIARDEADRVMQAEYESDYPDAPVADYGFKHRRLSDE